MIEQVAVRARLFQLPGEGIRRISLQRGQWKANRLQADGIQILPGFRRLAIAPLRDDRSEQSCLLAGSGA
jgi:hypothetical protein